MNHTIASSSMTYEPSFSTELNPAHGFFHTLWHMPWVASDRVTVDYFPGMSRGAWEFRRVILGVSPVNRGAGWAKQGENKVEPAVDLLSSGTSASARSSTATSNMPGSPSPRGGRRRSSQRRDSRRLFYSPNQYTFVDVNANSTPPLRVKKKARQSTKPREKHPSRSHSHRQRERERPRHRTHNTFSAVPPVPPVPPLPTYPHGYAPYAPTASPLYLFQPPQPLSPSNTNVDANQSHAQNPGLLSPIFMPMVPAVFTSGSIGTASPPGLAGRGAGGGYGPPGPTGNFPGGFGMSPVSESTPKPKHESL
ncbi:hypothetical protein Moror_6436 [Moniliophthora roreri MCA 2997]|uniref:Uncharacterized protein n=1 Tax=Moniliophthora roreri (strain MCA 2997) TaxID=1381753 RepID=V2XCD8_MONRO|nr:hypothetical protein Moror_6436 [Moniliophthora roreri MCA 2997]